MMRTLYIKPDDISETLTHLQTGGREGKECVVLWLGRNEGEDTFIHQIYRPDQWAESDIFRIPEPSMHAVMNMLDANKLVIAAQVHSHPFEAFHSRADDDWAIVRHTDALSLVVPDFALRTSVESFFDNTKSFRLTSANRWVEIPRMEVPQWLQVH